MTAEKNRPMCAALMSIADAARRGCRPLPIIRTDVATVVAVQRAINFEMGGQIANAARDQTRHWPWAMYDGVLILCDEDDGTLPHDDSKKGGEDYWGDLLSLWRADQIADEETRLKVRVGIFNKVLGDATRR